MELPVPTFSRKLLHCHHAAQGWDTGFKQMGQPLGLAEGDQKASAGVLQYTRLALRIFFQPAGLKGWIDGHRDAAGQQNSEKGKEKVLACRKHHRDCFTLGKASARETVGHRGSARQQICVVNDLRSLILTVKVNVCPRRIAFGIELKHMIQRDKSGRIEERWPVSLTSGGPFR